MPDAPALSSTTSRNSYAYAGAGYTRHMGHLSPDAAAKVRQAMSLLKERYGSVSALARALDDGSRLTRRRQDAPSEKTQAITGTYSLSYDFRLTSFIGIAMVLPVPGTLRRGGEMRDGL